MDKIKVQI